MRSPFIVSALFLVSATAASFAISACSSADSKEGSAESEVQQSNLGGNEGDACGPHQECKPGLLCKDRPSGPPPGAVGLPLPPDEAERTGGPPPGAVGLPLPPSSGTCQKPGPGEEGGKCDVDIPCGPGLYCDYFGTSSSSGSGGPPPGAVGLPLPPDEGESSGPPPGAVGLPLPPGGICKPSGSSSSGGPPPGAVGLPLPPND